MLRGYVFAILSAVIYGCMPVMAKFIYAQGVDAMTLVFLRNVLSLPALALIVWKQRGSLAVPARSFWGISIPGFFGCAITPVLLYSSYRYMASGVATVFHFVYPCLVLVLGFLFMKKKPASGSVFGVLICFAGILMFYDPGEALDWRGVAFSLASGLTFAVYVVILPRFQNREFSGFYLSFYLALWSSILMLLFCLFGGGLKLPTSLLGWGMCFFFANILTIGAGVLFQQGIFYIGGERTAILSALEPITGVVIGILVFRESAKLSVLLGSALVVAATVLIAVMDMKEKRKAEKKTDL